MASTSSSSTPPRKHDVFLSFRGEDTRKTIVDHLYYQLVQKGIHTFRDDKGLEKGRQIAELLPIIKESRFAIVVFSRNYASSKWCLEEIATIMECQQQYGEEIMIPIFYDVEPREVGNQTGSFGKSFAEHEKRFKDDKAKVKRWRKALKDASKISGYNLKNEFNGYEGVFTTKVVGDILRRLPPPSGQQNLVGLKSQLAEIRKLLEMSSTDTKLILGICGMGGIGKTTLARAIFDNIFSEFDHFSFLYDVRTNKMEDLQVKLLNDSSIHPVLYGISTIKDRLKSTKVLIVLDDVDHKEQLDKLVEDGEWLREGSRVIITTRNKQLLNSFRVVKMKCYDVKKMDEGKALELFSCHAFGKEYPDKEFEDLSRDFVAYADGLPLALKLWGSALCTNDREFWKCTLEKIKSIPGGDLEVCQKLKISYDGLDEDQKKIFLNIACFFRHKRWDHVKDALESCGLHPGNGIKVLIKKCLLFESRDGNIDMHDLIQDMGWYVANQEKPRTRLWQRKDVESCRKMEPKHKELIEGFLFSSTNNRTDDEKTLRAVKEMINLKILIVGGADENFPDLGNFLPRSLRWLDFLHYNSLILRPLGSIPSELVGFCVPHSSLLNCRITKRLDNLTYLDLSYSRSLSKTPNFKWIPNLKRLYLSYCVELKKIHPSIGNLHKLVLLDLSNCYELEKLPCFVQVLSLQFLKLEHCGALQNFPEIQTNMQYVEELNLEYIGIRELPSSIRHLCGLTKLRLCGCEDLVSLSDDLCELKSLKIFELRDCGQLESFPENLGNLSKLKELLIFDTAIFQLPPSITRLSLLECLCWGGNEEIQEIDEGRSLKFVPSVAGLRSLKRLQLSDFNIIDEGLPSDLEYLVSLEYLSLRGSDFVDLPESFSQLPRLQYLDIKGCRQLKKLPETTREEEEQPDLPKLPESTRELYADSRFASRRNITKLLAECPELHAVAFSDDGNDPCMGRPELHAVAFSDDGNDPCMGRPEYFLAQMCIRFSLPRIPRETPFSVSYSVAEESPYGGVDESLDDAGALRLFQYRCYQSNGISIDLTNDSWYRNRFVGFAVYFISSGFDMWGPHSYEGIHCVEHCTAIAKLSHNNNRNKDRQRECVIVNADDYTCGEIKGHICFAYIPFSSLRPESSTNTTSVTAEDFSRFEVKFKNLEATADWGCSFLYQWKRPASRKDICSCTHRLPSRNYICPECRIDDYWGPLDMLKYMNLSRLSFKNLPSFISQFRRIQYLDISGCARVTELPELPLTLKELYAPYNRSLASENNITELATKHSKLSSVSFSFSMHDNDDRAFLKPGELAEKFIPITQPFLNRNTPFAVSYPSDIMWSDDYKIGKCFKYTHNDSNKISISLDPTWYNHSFVGFVVCFQFPIKVRWESHPAILPFRHCELIAKLTHKDNGSEPDPLQTKCVIGRLYDEEFYDHFEDGELECFAYIPFSSLWPKSEVITDTTTPNHYSVFEAAFQDLEISKHFNAEDWEISTDWSCGLLYTDDKSLIEELQQKRENGSSESDSEEEEEEEEDDEEDDEEDEEEDNEDDGSQHEDDAMTEDNNLGHSAELPIDISDDGSEPSEHGDSGAAMAKHRAEMLRGIRFTSSGVKTCIGSPPTKKRTRELSLTWLSQKLAMVCTSNPISSSDSGKEGEDEEMGEPLDGDEDGEEYEANERNAGHGVDEVDSVDEEEGEDEQRKKARLNKDKTPEDIIINSRKQNKGKNKHGELLVTKDRIDECIELEPDYNIFHHSCPVFVMIDNITDLLSMEWLDASIIQVFIMYLHWLCKQSGVNSIGFMCPRKIAKDSVDRNVDDVIAYVGNTMANLQDKTFILAPYHQVNHWLLLVICTSSRMIYVLDPMQYERDIRIKPTLNKVFQTYANQWGQQTGHFVIGWKNIQCPQQPGSNECGYYVMRYMYEICTTYSAYTSLDEAFQEIEPYSKEKIDEIRTMWEKFFYEI